MHTGAPALISPLVAVIITGTLGVVATRSCRTEFPKGFRTAGDLARWIMEQKVDLANCGTKGWTREEVAAGVRKILVEILGCESRYHEDASIISDLGAG